MTNTVSVNSMLDLRIKIRPSPIYQTFSFKHSTFQATDQIVWVIKSFTLTFYDLAECLNGSEERLFLVYTEYTHIYFKIECQQ